MANIVDSRAKVVCSHFKSKFKFSRTFELVLTVIVIASCVLALDNAADATGSARDAGAEPSRDSDGILSPSGEDSETVPRTDTETGEDITDDCDGDNLNEGDGDDDDDDYDEDDLWLFQYDPVEVGYEQDVEVEPGMVLKMKTLAMRPPVFEIKNFLSHEECDHVISLALRSGLATSQVIPDSEVVNPEDESLTAIKTYFNELDKDGDTWLDATELLPAVTMFPAAKGKTLTPENMKHLIKEKLDQDSDGFIDLNEFLLADSPEMEDEIEDWLLTYDRDDGVVETKRSQPRVSDQTWLDQWSTVDQILLRLQDRVIGLTLLPSEIIQTSEHLQVVRYQPGGHYHAHYDSAEFDDNLECAHTFGIEDDENDRQYDSKDFSKKRLCRLATVLYYLNDVEEGGETAFPVADNETFTQEAIEDMSYDIYDLTRNCHKSNIVVPPEKGKAIMWYNHYLDEEEGWLGDNRNYSLHGGCDVITGTKWIANNWINVDNFVHRQILHHQRHFSSYGDEPPPSGEDDQTRSELADDNVVNNSKDEGYESDSDADNLTKMKDDSLDGDHSYDQSPLFDAENRDEIRSHRADEL